MEYLEKRKFLRLELNTPITITHILSKKKYQAYADNLSASGIAFSSAEPFSPGEKISVSIQTPGISPLEFKATVIRSAPDQDKRFIIAAAKD